MDSLDLRTKYKFLLSTFTAPFFPASLPLVKGQQIKLTNFMKIANLTIKIEEITDKNISVSLNANSEKKHFYGKAVLHKETGWLEKMALVKETPVEDRRGYTLRTVLLV